MATVTRSREEARSVQAQADDRRSTEVGEQLQTADECRSGQSTETGEQLAADARLLVAPAPGPSSAGSGSSLVSRLRMGSAASRAAALEELESTAPALPALSVAAAVSAVAALLDSEASAVVPHLCRALESGAGASTAEYASTALLPLTASWRDVCAAVAACGGWWCSYPPAPAAPRVAQAAAAGVLRNLTAFPNLLPAFHDEGGAVRGGGKVLDTVHFH
ncbi:uncharacterized protein [Miscanthus floridulus]|uniref:uncharacterized protein n=1 Tax=Miscanthus floridulus TaxID=154761 RepID=UPI003457440B